MIRHRRKATRPRPARRWRDRPDTDEDDEREAIIMCLDCEEKPGAPAAPASA